ncbi:MAG: outer membrane beta-barrel protein [Gammaproteobacteria bacterium]|nr:outer membrane beta-barrel protein [Gammaproteobacteria bacterium]
MFKKLVIASAVLAASSGIAFAGHSYKGDRDYKGEMSVPSCPTCATYSFMSGPYVGLSAAVRNNYSGAPAIYKGIEGRLSLGYAGVLTPGFYLAGELFGGDSFQVKNYRNADGAGARSTWTWGGSIIPGIMLTDYVMAFARVGGERTRFSNQSANASAWHVGVGGQTNICPNWDLRGEYTYSSYGSVTALGHPSTDLFSVGVIYKFM